MMRSIIAAVIAAVASASFADRTANQGWVSANFAPSNVVPRVEALERGSIPSQVKRWAMFIIPLDNQFYGFELKASTNNFLRSSPENARLVFYSQSELADETIGPNDRMRLYVCSYEYGEDGRSYTRIPNTMEETRKWHELVAIVSVDYLVRTDGSWLRDDNDSLVWCYIRNTEDDHELDRAGHLLWRPCAPARWFSALPEWAR